MFLTLILLTWRIWWAPNNASRWQVGFNSAFKELNKKNLELEIGSATSSGGQKKRNLFHVFPYSPLEAALSMSTFSF